MNRGFPLQPFTSLIDSDLSGQQKLIGEIQLLLLDKLSIRVESTDMDLLEAGVLDSVAQVQLLLHLEKHFDLHLPMEELEVDSFRSVTTVAELVADRVRARAVRTAAADSPTATELTQNHSLILELQALFLDKLSIQVEPEKDLFATGVFDSMALVQFILLLEDHFGIHVPLEDLEIDSFRSVAKIAELVANRKWKASEPKGLNGAAMMHAKTS
jgi:acyl carrier protein